LALVAKVLLDPIRKLWDILDRLLCPVLLIDIEVDLWAWIPPVVTPK
jgi:hypothetical protein